MTTSSFPSAIDSFTDPTSTQPMNQAPQTHSQMHTLGNDAIVAVETFLKAKWLYGTGDNGTTDNYASLQSQLSALSNGGFAILPPAAGYYGVSQDLVLPTGCWLLGMGPWKTKGLGSTGTPGWGSAIGPYNGSVTWTNGVVNLKNQGVGLKDILVSGINSSFYANAAPSAVYVGGSSTSTASRIYNCVIWGGLLAAIYMDLDSDDLLMSHTYVDNGTFTGTVVVGTSPAGLTILNHASSDIRFDQVQAFNAPVQIGLSGSGSVGGNDFKWTGGHISNCPAGLPSMYLEAPTGGGMTGMTIDNGNANLLCHIERNNGTWSFADCRFQNGSNHSYPVFQSNVDTSTGDSSHGLLLSNIHISLSGSASAFSTLINYSATSYPAAGLDNLSGIQIEGNAMAPGSGNVATLYTGGIQPTYARGVLFGGVPQPDLPNYEQYDLRQSATAAGLGESIPRMGASITNQAGILTSGTLLMVACALNQGISVGHLSFVSGGTALATGTHWWFGLYDLNRVQLATTADQTSTAWGTNTEKTLAIATIASGASTSFTTTYTGLYYVGIMVAATTPPSLLGNATFSQVAGLTPILTGTSDTGQTTPPAFPHTATAITAATGIPYALVAS